MRSSASKLDSATSDEREPYQRDVQRRLQHVGIPAAQIAQKTVTPASPRTTLKAVHNDGTGSKYVSKTSVTRQSVELRNRTNASFLWGFE